MYTFITWLWKLSYFHITHQKRKHCSLNFCKKNLLLATILVMNSTFENFFESYNRKPDMRQEFYTTHVSICDDYTRKLCNYWARILNLQLILVQRNACFLVCPFCDLKNVIQPCSKTSHIMIYFIIFWNTQNNWLRVLYFNKNQS